jgi:transposase
LCPVTLVRIFARVRTAGSKTKPREVRGEPLDVARELVREGKLDAVVELVGALTKRNAQLEQLIAALRARRNKAEGVSKEQLSLALEELAAIVAAGGDVDAALANASIDLEQAAKDNGGRSEATKPPPQPALRRPPPPHLRRVKNPIPVPDAERACPSCGTARTTVKFETTEVIDLIPAEVIVRLDEREVCACPKCDAEMARAPQGDKVVVGGAYGSQLVASLVVGKYADGLPLHRQHEVLKRLGFDMPSSSMADQITWSTDLLAPIWRGLIAVAQSALLLHVDATSMPVRDKETKGAVHLGALWGYVGGDADGPYCAVYLFTSTGKKVGQRECEVGPEEFLLDREGFVVADAGSVFDLSFKREELCEIGCNMHARRYFVKAFEAGDKRAAVAIAAFRALYDVEDAGKGDVVERQRLRAERSRPVYDKLLEWARLHRRVEPPESLLAKALGYLLNHEVALTRFLDDGRLPIDNGVVERLHRDVAILRNNCLFAGSYAGGQRAAIALSIIGTCEMLDINPMEYLASVLPELARSRASELELRALLPAAWKAARDAALTTANAHPA